MKSKSDINVMLKETGRLFLITLIAGLLLGFVYELTKEPIKLQEEKAIKEACAQVFKDANSFELISYVPNENVVSTISENGVEIGNVFEAKGSSKELLGYVIEAISNEGYGGDIVLYLGVRLDGTLNGVSILEISETAGLGMRAEEVLVPQFKDKNVLKFNYTKTGSNSDSEVDAISGATITTKAVVNAVNGGLEAFDELTSGGVVNE